MPYSLPPITPVAAPSDSNGTGGLPAYAGDESLWDDDISLHGPETFYNWEQDNIPLIQLANRTAWLYAQIEGQSMAGSNLNYGGPGVGTATPGVVGSTVNFNDGIVLTLSSTSDRSRGIYSDLSRLLSNVPKKLKYPLTIEICKYGDLGALNIHGISCEGSGALEIVNRTAAMAHGGLSGTTGAATTKILSVATAIGAGRSLTANHPRDGKTSTFSTPTMPTTFSSLQLWADISGASSVKGPSLYASGSWNASGRCFTVQHPTTDSKSPAISLHVASATTGLFIADGVLSAQPTFSINAYTASSNDLSVSSSDALAVNRNGFGGTSFTEDSNCQTAWAANGKTYAAAYGSYFSKVSIRGCTGEYIKLKNILVDSGEGNSKASDDVSNANHEAINGFDIMDSEVILEGTASIRNKHAGYSINNSKVKFNKGVIAYRNYPLEAGGVREPNAQNTSFEAADPILKNGVGLYCNNSTVLFDTETDNASPLGSYYTSATLPGYYPYYFGNNGTGVYSKNSYIGGGSLGYRYAQGEDSQTSKIIASNNTKGGFHLETTTFNYRGIPWAYLNEGHGIHAVGSTLKTTGLVSEYNENNGLFLDNSNYVYGYGAKEISSSMRTNTLKVARGTRTDTVHTCTNGNHNIKLSRGSSMHPEKFPWMDSTYGGIGGNGENFSMQTSGGNYVYHNNVPMISVDDNSYGEFISFASEIPSSKDLTSYPTRGCAASITNGSHANFIGTSSVNTMSYRAGVSITNAILGSGRRDWEVLNAKASFYAGKNSTLKMAGPTKISGLGIGVLGEDNSTVEFGPVTDKDSNSIEVINYDLSAGAGAGHTKVDIHSLRACVVVNNKSNLIVKNLGGSSTQGISSNFKNTSSVDRLYLEDTLTHASTSAGYFQLYPNGFTDAILQPHYSAFINLGTDAYSRTGSLGSQAGISTGGMCVRAVGGSFVDLNGVNFPMGMESSSVSGVYYNIDGSGSEHTYGYAGPGGNGNNPGASNRIGGSRILIWNLADTSKIHAANLLVSGVSPALAGGGTGANYHGPAGRWFNDVGLDYYGADGAAGFSAVDVTLASYENNGPFRLMFGTRGAVKNYFDLSADVGISVGTVSATGGTPIDQVNGQGYMLQVSSVSSLPNSDPTYTLQFENEGVGAAVFGAYKGTSSIPENYIGSMGNGLVSVPVLHGEWQGYMRNYIDESAANTFANAKHAANERVGFVSIYNSTTNPSEGGEGRDSYDLNYTYGQGVRSLNLFDLDRMI